MTEEEELYDLVVFSDGDARVYSKGEMSKEGYFRTATGKEISFNVVQSSPDKELLIKIAKMARAEYVQSLGFGEDEPPDFLLKAVDQTRSLTERMTR